LFSLTSLLLGLVLITVPNFALAIGEINKDTIEVNVDSEFYSPSSTDPVECNEDVEVIWSKPDLCDTCGFNGYVYKWTNSENPMNDNELNSDTVNASLQGEGLVTTPTTTVSKSTNASFFADDDTGSFRYLHLKTWYTNSTGHVNYSDDVVIGPINIDNVSPDGTINIVDSNGDSIESTTNLIVDVDLNVDETSKYYLSESAGLPSSVNWKEYTDIAKYELSDDTAGDKTIYAWFKDEAGNISSDPATDTFTLLESTHISPYSTSIDMQNVSTKDFTIEGSSAGYDWSVTNSSVAQISGESSNVNTITLELLAGGTCKLEATPSAGGETLTSGNIEVKQAFKKGDANGDGNVDIFDGVLFVNYLLGKKSKSDIKGDFDLNNDRKIDIFDGVRFVNYLLGKKSL